MTQDWLKNLKAGDKVFIDGRTGKTLTIVQKITPTGRVVANNIQFINGVNHSDKWNVIVLEEATEEEKEKIRKYIKKEFTI